MDTSWDRLLEQLTQTGNSLEFFPEFLGYQVRGSGWRHPDWERGGAWHIAYLFLGGRVRLPAAEIEVGAGDGLLVAPGRHGPVAFEPGSRFLEVWFACRGGGDSFAAAPGLLSVPAALDARGPFERLCGELSSGGCRTTPVIRHALGLLLACLLAAARRLPGRPGLTSEQRTRLIRWTREHLAHRPDVADLARVVGLSPDYFARRFRASFGISPRRWLAEERIRGVARALIDRDDPIHAVAADFGFEDPSHFGRQFRRVIGRSPGAWRRHPTP